ncbi:MAG: hypothetical protein RTU63_14295 [Candidatus Thorarchaeota archaeon]
MSVFQDLNYSFREWKGFFLRYLRALGGMLFLLYILIVIFTLPIGLAFWTLGLGIPGANFIDAWVNNLYSYFLLFWIPTVFTGDITVILTVFFVLSLPIVVLTEWVLGPVYGLSRDVATSGDVSGDGAFNRFRKKAGSFLGTGIVNATIVIGPLGIIIYLLDLYYGFAIPSQLTLPLLTIAVLYVYISLGFLKLNNPAVADDMGVFDGLKKSVSLVKSNFVRVFGSWTIYFILLISWFVPIVIWAASYGIPGTIPSLNLIEFGFSVTLAGVGFLLDLLIFLPIMILGMTKIYHDISKKLLVKIVG